MKKVLFFLIALISITLGNAQTKKKAPVKNAYETLSPVDMVISRCGIYNSMSLLSTPKTFEAKRASELIDPFIKVYQEDKTYKDEWRLLSKYKSQIAEYYKGISSFGESKGVIKLADVNNFPSTFATYNNKLTFVQTSVYSDYNYNTLRLNANARAMKAATDIALPSLYNFEPLLEIPEIQFFMIVVGYTAKDFTSDSIADSDAETIALLVSKANLKRYIRAEITDEQLLKLSIIYNINKATGNNIKKLTT
ncbi:MULTISPECIES: hypothetical protein [Sphingobacterium]|uniref:hypothetical protein n=1 Tax=Sphingobacterium TaxID=28453 RepID=UPI00257F62CA|nr:MULTISPECIES: hypothetical protein [Sphingobacterium]